MKRNLDRLAIMETVARRLARSGRHDGYYSIQYALLEQGYSEATKLIANPWTRGELDRICQQASRLVPHENEARSRDIR